MKFTTAELADIKRDIEEGRRPSDQSAATVRLAAFISAELSDAIENDPDTIELYFTNGYRLGGISGGANPFERRNYATVRTTGRTL